MSPAAAAPTTLRWDCADLRWRPAPVGPPGPRWIGCAGLLAPGSAELERRLALVTERQDCTRLSVAASLLLERHSWALATAAFGSLLGQGLLPDLAAANVCVRLDAGGFADSLLLARPRLEPVAPGETLEALGDGLLAGHLLPLVERLVERPVHRGRRALLCLVADALAAAIAGAATAAGTPAAEADALAGSVAALLGSPPSLRPRLLRAGASLVRKRAVCCLLHTERAAHCATCPHLPDGETVRRMRAL